MRSNIVFTLTGPDRVGIVESVTKMLLDLGGNVETSRMARLGGEFAMLMLVSLPEEKPAALDEAAEALTAQGYKVTTSGTRQTCADMQPGWRPFHIEVQGADHEGIIHQVARHLAERGINIESMETGVDHAPVSGTPIFTMSAVVAVPPGLADHDWQSTLEEAGGALNVDIRVSPLEKQ
ncbi:MAG TPA: ACT domain-containing protein [Geobacteraceae bacterium]|nr:ACT domain-containing protein [Geobacteraceae bacterium]